MTYGTRHFPTTGPILVYGDWVAQKVDCPAYAIRVLKIHDMTREELSKSWDYRRDEPGIIESEARQEGVHEVGPLLVAFLMTLEHDYQFKNLADPEPMNGVTIMRQSVQKRYLVGFPESGVVATNSTARSDLRDEARISPEPPTYPVARATRRGLLEIHWYWRQAPESFKATPQQGRIPVDMTKTDGEILPGSPLAEYIEGWK